MFAKALGVKLNLKPLDLFAGEHLKPEFVQVNPQHSVPVLVDAGFTLWESRAVLGYLADKYGKNDAFYPKDPQKRAVVDQRLYFDMGTLYKAFSDYYYPQMMLHQPADPENLKKLEEAAQFLDGFLAKTKYSAGDAITIADYSLIATNLTLAVAGFDHSRFKNVNRWLELCKKTVPGIEVNDQGLEAMKQLLQQIKK